MIITGEAAYQQTAGIVDKANAIIREADKHRQIKKITKIYKYKFGWSRKIMFLYILKSIPEAKARIVPEALKGYNISMLYAALSKKELSLIIKRLEQIEKRNDWQKEEDEI